MKAKWFSTSGNRDGPREGSTLTARQLAVFVTCYTVDKQHIVRDLAADLNVSKSVDHAGSRRA